MKTNLVAAKPIVLSTKTPLGEASITLPTGTTLTNSESVGEDVIIRQGPFTASIKRDELQSTVAAEATAPTSPTPAVEQAPEPSPATTPAPARSPTADANSAQSPPAADAQKETRTPDWLVPAAGGALAAYALLTTVALFRSQRRPRRTHGPQKKEEPTKPPVITLPQNQKLPAKPAVIAEGGRALSCPLCGKNIPMEKIGKGRNQCPSCRETFVVE